MRTIEVGAMEAAAIEATGAGATAAAAGMAAVPRLARSEGGSAAGVSKPFSLQVMSLHATENSFKSIRPSPFMSARPLQGVTTSYKTLKDVGKS